MAKYIFDKNLDKEKLKAIKHTKGPLLIIAGPGSGKTKTLVEKVIYLIIEKKLKAEEILIATFTQKAANELITRISNRIIESNIKCNLNEMYIGTLHSIFLRLLEEFREFTNLKKNYRMLDDFDLKFLIYENVDKFSEIENVKDLIGESISKSVRTENILKYVGKIAEETYNLEDLKNSNDATIIALVELYEKYVSLLNENNCLDFSSIQSIFHELLKNETIKMKLQRRFKYLMIDEYQDTNSIQETIIMQMLNNKKQNICVVGDDDQALYRFRGASIQNILEFPKIFNCNPKFKQIKLENNYRSHPSIIDYYSNFIHSYQSNGISNWTENEKEYRYDKSLKASGHKYNYNTSVIKVSSNESEEAWHNEILDFINFLKNENILEDYNQIAFLFKSVKSEKTLNLVNFLENNNIHIFSPRSNLYFEREEIKLLIGAFISIFPEIENKLEWTNEENKDTPVFNYYLNCKNLFDNNLIINENEELKKWIENIRIINTDASESIDYSLSNLFYNLLSFPLFAKYLNVELNLSVKDLRATYNVSQFSKILSKFEFIKNVTTINAENIESISKYFFNSFLRFLYRGGIEEFNDFDEYAPKGSISFLTIHQSKGLEFPIVVVASLNSVPKNSSEKETNLDNQLFRLSKRERYEPIDKIKYFDFYRLYYTAFSRSQNLLVLSTFEKNKPKSPSSVFEIQYNSLQNWRNVESELRNITLENIKKVNIKKQYAFTSDIVLYEKCQLQYKFYKEFEFTPVKIRSRLFGVLVHQTIEDVHKKAIANKIDEINDENIELWFNQNYKELSIIMKKDLSDLQKVVALENVIKYTNKNKNDWNKIQEAEVDVSLVKDTYILKGQIDLLKGDNNTVEIIDFKSDKEKPIFNIVGDKNIIDQYQRQLNIYAHIIEEKNNLKVSKTHLYYTGFDDPYITFDVNQEEIEETINGVSATIANIEQKSFTRPEMNKRLCRDCDFSLYCQAETGNKLI